MARTVSPGIEALIDKEFRPLAGIAAAVLTNHAAVSADGTPLLDLLLARADLRLVRVLAPEHGHRGLIPHGIPVPESSIAGAGIPVQSLYPGAEPGGSQIASAGALSDAELLLIDLPDSGARYFTYLATTLALLRRAALARVPVLLLDRPNPLGGTVVEGPLLDQALGSLVGAGPVPIRHGLTFGEVVTWMNTGIPSPPDRSWTDERIGAELTVLPVTGWDRSSRFESTGLPWVAPSPNLPSPQSALVYAGSCLFEGTPLSVGRGTNFPFTMLGHPAISAERWIERLPAAPFEMAGAAIRPTRFVPRTDRHAGRCCEGIVLDVTDPERFQPVRGALSLLCALRAAHPELFAAEQQEDPLTRRHLDRLWGSPLLSSILFAEAAPGPAEYSAISAELRAGEEWFCALRDARLQTAARETGR